ncbi:MAG: hypothetical protein P4L39_02090 [Humidesulfovibrio sp.]|nr:hypothetical protein [Humidesulfovibrio sp.]
MKRFPKILVATCAALALTASLALAADATSAKSTVPATAQINCPGAVSGQMGSGMMGSSQMGSGRMGYNNTGTRANTGQTAGTNRSL